MTRKARIIASGLVTLAIALFLSVRVFGGGGSDIPLSPPPTLTVSPDVAPQPGIVLPVSNAVSPTPFASVTVNATPPIPSDKEAIVSDGGYWVNVASVTYTAAMGGSLGSAPAGTTVVVSPTSSEASPSSSPTFSLTGEFPAAGYYDISLAFGAIFTDSDGNTYTGSASKDVYVTAESLRVVMKLVPQYLFASAKYATPIKFQIVDPTGTASKFTVNSITVLMNNGLTQIASFTTTSRFAADNGSTQSNGSSDTYTCFVPASTYGGISLNPNVTSKAAFVAIVNATPVGVAGAAATTASTDQEDAAAKVTLFADSALLALDIAPASAPATASLPMASDVTSEGLKGPKDCYPWLAATFQHWQHGSDAGDTLGVPHEDDLSRVAFLGFADGVAQGITNSANDIGLTTLLEDDRHVSGDRNSGEGVKNRIYGKRLGGVFYVSYGGRDLPTILSAGERAMDLSVQSGNFDIDMFPTAQARVLNVCDQSGGVHASALTSAAFGLATAFAEGYVGVVLEAAQFVFATVDAVDVDTNINGRAEGAVYRILTRTRVGGAKTTDGSFFPPFTLNSNGDTGYVTDPFTKAGTSCDVGDQWVSFVELESASSAVSTLNWPFGGAAYAQNGTDYKTLNSSEFSTYTVTISQ